MFYTSWSVKQQKKRKGKPWRATFEYKDSEGNRHQKTATLREAKGKKEAEQIAQDMFYELNHQKEEQEDTKRYEETVDKKFTEYLEYQLETSAIQPTTYNVQLFNFNKYTKPILGDILFDELSKSDIKKWITHLHNIGLKENTIHTVFSQFKKLYTHYYETGELEKDPFKGITSPRKGKPKITHLTKEQMNKFEMAVKETYEPKDAMYCGFFLAYYSGLRRGEICGLRWRDIDFDRGLISVSSSIGIAKGGEYTKDPKNTSSKRTFPMTPQLYEALKERYDIIKPEQSYFVIGNKKQYMSVNTYSRKFREFCINNGLTDAYEKRIVPHGLRHNVATVGIRSGMDIASLSLMLGHASRAMTLDTYGDANADALKIAIDKLALKFDDESEIGSSDETAEKLYAIEEKLNGNKQDAVWRPIFVCKETLPFGISQQQKGVKIACVAFWCVWWHLAS